ncbi:LexA family protein [Streptomyces mirabilis]|uniref:LexA family protein n=1 Tax=Streptomyces mirabilis TaxID=68239 RepID=UPI0036C07A6D
MKLASTSSVARQLMDLERKGVLCRDPHHPAPTGSGLRGCGLRGRPGSSRGSA